MLLCVRSLSNFSTASLAFSEESYGNDSGLAVYVAKAIDPTLCWDDITWLKSHTRLPVIVKGVLNGTRKSSKWTQVTEIWKHSSFKKKKVPQCSVVVNSRWETLQLSRGYVFGIEIYSLTYGSPFLQVKINNFKITQ